MNITENTAENTSENTIDLYDPAVQASMSEVEWHREAWKQAVKRVAYPGHEKWKGDPEFPVVFEVPGLVEYGYVRELPNYDKLTSEQQAMVRELLGPKNQAMFHPMSPVSIDEERWDMSLSQAVDYINGQVCDGLNVFSVAGKSGYMIEHAIGDGWHVVHCCHLHEDHAQEGDDYDEHGNMRPCSYEEGFHHFYITRNVIGTMFAYVASLRPYNGNIEEWAIHLYNWGLGNRDEALFIASSHFTDELMAELGIVCFQF